MTENSNETLCVICGDKSATTRDHIPPKGIFSSPRPSDIITVPACRECNNNVSGLDEKFRVYLSLHVGVDSPQSKNLWEQHALKSLRHNQRLRNKIVEQMEPVYLKTREGIIFGKGHRGLWDSTAHDTVIERAVRGLYYHHFQKILGKDAVVKVQWFRELNKDMYEMSKEWTQNSVGGDQFIYRFAQAKEEPIYSVWIFQFYKRHWAGAHTSPIHSSNSPKPM